ncbi:uncharacterized protein ISCGN_003878 [Ixodes scapularis]
MGDGKALCLYTDAAQQGERTAIAWYCDTTEPRQGLELFGNLTVKEAKFQALLLAVREAQGRLLDETSKPSHIYCYSDSRQVVYGCGKHCSRGHFVEKIHAVAKELRRDGHKFTVKRIPGHQGVYGNEIAHNAEREGLS